MALNTTSPIEHLLERVNFLTPHQEEAVRTLLPDKTVQDLLNYETAQELANELEREARKQYEHDVAEQGKSPEVKRADEFLQGPEAPLQLHTMGDVAYRLLTYVHRMFDPMPGATPGVSYM